MVWRPAAEKDAVDIAAYYAAEGGPALELKFIDALAATFDLIARQPVSGSTRHAALFPELPAPLRFHPLRHFERILVYYMAMPAHVEVIRLWDAARGLDALLDGTDTSTQNRIDN
ncbi:MAG TPA: type II toxin-antitoxin system RelE/ParE family toxin [Rhodanobacter sp.]|nr:type II toxin-antitoxin system RelE/ParE family toxin [Rhodanobacter sp.]